MADYFTPDEQALVARTPAADQSRLLALLWSAKESALKALRCGLRLDTRRVIVSLIDPLESASNQVSWRRLQVSFENVQFFQGWWRESDHLLRTLVADTSSEPPIVLKVPNLREDLEVAQLLG